MALAGKPMTTTTEARDRESTEHTRTVWLLAGSMVLIALFFWNLWHPMLRFDVPMLNYGIAAIVLSSPWVLASWVWMQPAHGLRPWALLLATVGALLALPLAWTVLSMASIAANDGNDLGLAVMQEVELVGTRIRVYRINPGGFSSYSYTARQERTLGGLVMVRVLCDEVPGGIGLTPLAPDRILIDNPACPERELRVDQRVWF